jgi:hypothetical protein
VLSLPIYTDMNLLARVAISLVLVTVLLSNALPCGPGYIEPLFAVNKAPETPFRDFATGRLGIIKPQFRRSVLIAAYRYVNGGGMNAIEQEAIIDVWNAEMNMRSFREDPVDDAVRAWVKKRKEIVGDEEKTPEIYTEREYGGYDFFPNCATNAFEVATATLSDRASQHGPGDRGVADWIVAQDRVFENCATGRSIPNAAEPGAPGWLQKDRAYQLAAADFYSLNYESARRRFAEIAADTDSPWQETANYLVARTLVRQASLTSNNDRAKELYDEAEQHLDRFARGGRFAPSAEKMLALIKYRTRPKERVSELGQSVASGTSGDNFRQNVIDYTWLMRRLSNEVLAAEQKRKEAEKAADAPTGSANTMSNATNAAASVSNFASNAVMSAGNSDFDGWRSRSGARTADTQMEINVYFENGRLTFFADPEISDAEAIAEAERVYGIALTAADKQRVRDARRGAYASRYAAGGSPDDTESYYGDDEMTRSLMPEYLTRDPLTDWIFTWPMEGAEEYLYALNRFRSDGSELWLMTALAKADPSSTGLDRLLETAANTSSTSAAYPTITYHRARLLVALKKNAEALRVIDDVLTAGDWLPISSRNEFLTLRSKFATTIDDFLRYSLKRPYAFDSSGTIGTIEDLIAQQKAYFNPEYNTEGKEAYERSVEENFATERLWQSREMFDDPTIRMMDHHFTTELLAAAEASPALPDYLRERFGLAIWTRAWLLGDNANLTKASASLRKARPEFVPYIDAVEAAKTPAAKDATLLYFVLKNPIFSPYIETGLGKSDNTLDEWDSNNWWCEPYDSAYDEETNRENEDPLPPRPAFLDGAATRAAQAERARLKKIGDAPEYLAARVLEWAKRSPTDRRVPEALYIMVVANGWNKYGCGNNDELREELAALLKKKYPSSPWAAKLRADEAERQ